MAKCKSCAAPIFWAESITTRRKMPVDWEPVAGGNIGVVTLSGAAAERDYTSAVLAARDQGLPLTVQVIPRSAPHNEYDGPRFTSHFATCPDREEHRKPKKRNLHAYAGRTWCP